MNPPETSSGPAPAAAQGTPGGPPAADAPRDRGTARWLSRELAELLAQVDAQGHADPEIDVLVVGSGYGGAIAAAELSGCEQTVDGKTRPVRVVMLERGREFLPGSFPDRVAHLPTEVRGRLGPRRRGGEGLFDLRLDAEMSVLVANGLGGGSLINAGVMERPDPAVFKDARWPRALQGNALAAEYGEAEHLLGAVVNDAQGQPVPNTIARHRQHDNGQPAPAKQAVLQRLSGSTFRGAAITVAMQEGATTVAGVKLSECKRCGDCATGCNHGAKESLDTNLLVRAVRQGARVYCGATVLRVEAAEKGWRVQVVHTDPKLRLREGPPRWLYARRVVLAAGTLGSSEILLRSAAARDAAPGLALSPALGSRFSGNGDLLAFGYDHRPVPANAIADEDAEPGQRDIGPTITGVLREQLHAGDAAPPMVVEELAVPGLLRRLTEEMLATADVLHSLGERDRTPHHDGRPPDDPCAVDPRKFACTSVFAAMGDDGALGRIELDPEVPGVRRVRAHGSCPPAELGAAEKSSLPDAQVRVRWPGARPNGADALAQAQTRRLKVLADRAGLGGRIIPNPLWQWLPPQMSALLGNAQGPLLTVHPLGGCPMADDAAHGVVDDRGRVYCGPSGTQVHPGLVVLDGSVVPRALAINPALTIAALSLRAVRLLRAEWDYAPGNGPERLDQYRPRIDGPAPQRARRHQPPRPTLAQFTERLGGRMRLRHEDGSVRDCWVDLTLPYQITDLASRVVPDASGRLVDARLVVREGRQGGRLRIFAWDTWKSLRHRNPGVREERDQIDAHALVYELSGTLSFLVRERTGALARVTRGLRAWWANRGARDVYQSVTGGLGQLARGRLPSLGAGASIRGAVALASRAGERRRFDYALTVGARVTPADQRRDYEPHRSPVGAVVLGHKRITYARPSNPWRQLCEMTVDQFPGAETDRAPAVLALDLRFLAARATPLFRLLRQRDHVTALLDALGLAMTLLRMVLPIHVWQARKPDAPAPRAPSRLPPLRVGRWTGKQTPHVVETCNRQAIANVVLTRYAPHGARTGLPVLAIHGYSASGTTFAHPALAPGMAGSLLEQGREVWLLDLRTSPDLRHADERWTFERVALIDIPFAVDQVLKQTGAAQVDVVAHCMGAAMLSMAILSAGEPDIERLWSPRDRGVRDPHPAARLALAGRVRAVVLSQAGPLPILSPVNTLRAYLASYIDHVLGPFRYEFRPAPGDAGAVLLDRLLSTLPYPDDELLRESPRAFWRRVPFAQSRHRMDALYGRAFKLGNVSKAVLDHLDDFFGPISLDTVTQVRHFAQHLAITNRGGRNRFVNHARLARYWPQHTLVLHGEHNGLLDPGTVNRLTELLRDAGRTVATASPGFQADQGHQDVLIGRNAGATFDAIEAFLRQVDASTPAVAGRRAAGNADFRFVARLPHLGPMTVIDPHDPLGARRIMALGADPQLGRPDYLCFVPLRSVDGRWEVNDEPYRRPPPGGGRGHPRELAVHLGEHPDTDWFYHLLPEWAGQAGLEVVAPVLIYAQSERMPGQVFDPGDSLRSSDVWVARGLGRHPLALALRKVALGTADRSRERHRALAQAVQALERLIGADHDDARDADRGPGSGQERHPAPRAADAPPEGVLHLRAEPVQGLCIALGSCQYAAGILDAVPAMASWQQLNRRIRQGSPAPDLMVLCGDQIYADATAGLFDPALFWDRYHTPHETWLRQGPVRQALGRVPLAALIDDHEIDDNWEPIDAAARPGEHADNQRNRDDGISAYVRYQRAGMGDTLWWTLQRGQVPMFFADARTGRSLRNTRTLHSAQMFDPAQSAALLAWLDSMHQAHPDLPKVIVTPVAVLPRRRYGAHPALLVGGDDTGLGALRSDTWDGFPATLAAVLGRIAEKGIRGVVFLSGDEHVGLYAQATLRKAGQVRAQVHSVHAPGLYTPYPFANARDHDFLLAERFALPGTAAGGVEAEVEATLVHARGFVQVELRLDQGVWTLDCTYHADAGEGGGLARFISPLV